MGKQHDLITSDLQEWISQQKLFFVATAPISAAGRINVSPKGGDSFRVLGELEVAYQDYTGSGAETCAHLRENGRIVVMFCALEGPPKIVRLHGTGTVITPSDPYFAELAKRFPENPGTRSFIRIKVTRISDSCGYSVPQFQFKAPRDALDKWAKKKGAEGLLTYRKTRNRKSIDGLSAFEKEV